MKKALSIALAAVMALTLATGCQKKASTVDEQGRTMLLIGLPGGDGVSAMKVVENFKNANADKYNVTTDEGAWSDFTKKVKLQIVAKKDVTPVFFSDSEQIMTFGAQGAAVDLKDWIDTTLDAEKYNKALYAVTDTFSDPDADHVWGVPHALNTIAMVYNKDIFDEAGVPYPTDDWTFDDMIAMAKKLTLDRDGDGQTDVWGIDYYHNSTQGWVPFMVAYGVSPYKDDYRNSNLDDPKVLEAMQKMRICAEDGSLIPDLDRQSFGGSPMAFAEGKVAMSLMQYSSVAAINNANPDLNYDAVIMPYGWSGQRPCIYVPNSWMIYSGVEENVKAAALDWLAYYLSEEAQMINATECPSGFPIMKSALEIAAQDKKPASTDAFFKGIDEHGATIFENPASSAAVPIMNSVGAAAKSPDKNPDLAASMQEAHAKLQAELDFFYENNAQ